MKSKLTKATARRQLDQLMDRLMHDKISKTRRAVLAERAKRLSRLVRCA